MYDPEHDMFPRIQTNDELEEHLKLLIKKNNLLFTGWEMRVGDEEDEDYESISYAIPIVFQNFETIIIIDRGEFFNITLFTEKKDRNDYCMHIEFWWKKKKLIGYVASINARTPCKIPADKKGIYLISLADAIIKSLGVQYGLIEDGTEISCGKENDISLNVYRIFQGKDSWYSNFGFDHGHKKERNELIEKFKNTPIKSLLNIMNENESISDFMIRLYESSDCKRYKFFKDWIFSEYNTDREMRNFEILKKTYY